MDLWTTDSLEQAKQPVIVTWQLMIDGASKNNPGPAGAGFVLMKNDQIIAKQGFYLGKKTNNQAEYYALILAIFFLLKYDVKKEDTITIVSDSLLLVRQMTGVYKVKDIHLAQLKNIAAFWLQGYRSRFVHVLRHLNVLADEMANRGVTTKTSVPQDFLKSLQQHDIIF